VVVKIKTLNKTISRGVINFLDFGRFLKNAKCQKPEKSKKHISFNIKP
jgi:hypothetical protein